MTVLRGTAAILAMACVPAAAPGQQSRWQHQVQAHLDQASATLTATGYAPAAMRWTGALDNGETVSDTLTLAAGATYVLLGVCDDDCDALELGLFAPNGYEVDAADRSGNAPIVRVTPRETARYRFTVRMTGCGMNPCWYGVRVFRRSP
jgi:hypothetical protein